MEKLVTGTVWGLVSILLVFSYLPGTESEKKKEENRQLVDLPIKDVFAGSLDNLTVGTLDFSRKVKKVRKRPGGNRGNGRRRYPQRRYRYRPRHEHHAHHTHGHSGSDSDYYSDEYWSPDDDYYYDYYYNGRRPESYHWPTGRHDACSMPRMRGKCVDLQKRWYFNNQVGQCRSFTYGGCGGNANNFVSQKNCEDFCAGGHMSTGKTEGSGGGSRSSKEVVVEEIEEIETENK